MAFVVSQGALQGLSVPAALPGARLQLAADYTADYAAIWRTQGAVRTVVDFLGRNIASLGLHQFRRVSDTDRERITDSGLIRTINRPNMATTRYRLLDALVRDYGIYDRAYWLKMKNKDGTHGLIRLPPSMVKPVGSSWLWPDAFEFTGTKSKKVFAADEIVHFRGYSPDGDLGGQPPIEALRRVLAEEYEAGRMRENTLRNGARASGYLERPVGAPSWSEQAAERFTNSWRSQYSGSGPQAGGTPVLEDGMKFVPASQTAEQLQYVEARKLTREEVAAAFFIPPTMVGVMDSATFSNIKEQHKHLYQDTLGPWLSMIAEELALQLTPDFDDSKDTYLEFNLGEKLRGSFEEQAAQIQTSVGGPWMTRNEARALSNLPAIEGGDELIIPLNVIEGGQASPNDSAPDTGQLSGPGAGLKSIAAGRTKAAPALDDGQRAAAVELFSDFFKRQGSAVLSAIGSGDSSWWDSERWNRELGQDILGLALSVSSDLGAAQAEALGFDRDGYDVKRTTKFLEAVAASRAEWVNNATRDRLQEVMDDDAEDAPEPASVFDAAEAQRSVSAGEALATTVAGFALVEAGKQLAGDQAVKTWVVTSANPRESHAAMDGETVPIDGEFSNGLNWPGDPVNGADEVAGCQCTVEITLAK